jgi:hypothetical protein
LLRGGKQTELEQKFLAITFKYYKDIEPAKYDIDELNSLLEYDDVDRFKAFILVYKLYYHFAHNDLENIKSTCKDIENCIDLVPEAFRYMLYTEIAFYKALYERDGVAYSALEPKTKSGFQEKATLARLAACKALLDHDKQAMISALSLWKTELKNLKTTASVPLELQWIAMFEADLSNL